MAGVDLGIPGLSYAQQVGAGGNAVVYRAREVDHDRWVAVKVLRGLADEAALRRFDRERRAMGRLSELEGIVTIHYSGFTDRSEPYLVMPLLSGSLQDRLDQSGPMPWREAAGLLAVVARTVDAAHGQDVIHRDLKPANIMMTASGAPLVADFGIAKLTSGTTTMPSTALTFTPSYSAPEVLEGAAPSAAADIYGLGVTLYALVAGAAPFVTDRDENMFALMRRIATEPVTDLRPRGVPDQVCTVIETAMSKDPEHRHRTAAEFATALEATLNEALDERPQAPTTPDEPQNEDGHQAALDQSTIVLSEHDEPEPAPTSSLAAPPEHDNKRDEIALADPTESGLLPDATTDPGQGSTPTIDASVTTVVSSDRPETPITPGEEGHLRPPHRHRRTIATIGAVILVIGGVVGAVVVVQTRDNTPETTAIDTTAAEAAIDLPGAEPASDEPPAQQAELTDVSLQLPYVPQSSFAGYFAARDLGFYQDVGLNVMIVEGLDISAGAVLAAGDTDFAIVGALVGLILREGGLDITNIAQVLQRSGTVQVAFADSGISTVTGLESTNVGNWGFLGNVELLAGLRRNGLDPDFDVTLVQQELNMLEFIFGELDSAQALIYDGYAQVLETINPDTGELFQPEDLNIIDWNDVGTAVLQDAIWADADRLERDADYRATAVAFVEASLRGWAHCRDNQQECVDIVVAAEPPFGGPAHQAWQMNEINALIWPSPLGVGIMDTDLWAQTVDIATSEGILATAPDDGAFRTDIAEEAIANLTAAGIDVTGDGFARITVEVTEGGN